MSIPWYMSDVRFEPGTVADVGHSLRLTLSKLKSNPNEWRLYMAIRTLEKDGITDRLTRSVKVAVFKQCLSLKDAQTRAESWFSNWRRDLY